MTGIVNQYTNAMQAGQGRNAAALQAALATPQQGRAQYSLPNTPPPDTKQYYQRGADYEANAANQRAQNAVQFNGTQQRGVYPSDMRDAMNQGAAAGMTYQNYQPMGTLVNKYLDTMAPNRMQPQPMGNVVYRR